MEVPWFQHFFSRPQLSCCSKVGLRAKRRRSNLDYPGARFPPISVLYVFDVSGSLIIPYSIHYCMLSYIDVHTYTKIVYTIIIYTYIYSQYSATIPSPFLGDFPDCHRHDPHQLFDTRHVSLHPLLSCLINLWFSHEIRKTRPCLRRLKPM